jgi:PQQ-like domain
MRPYTLWVACLAVGACGGSNGTGLGPPSSLDSGASADAALDASPEGATTGDGAARADSPAGTGTDAATDGASGSDAGSRTDAAPRSCGTSEWPTYGHDAQRTGASDGCMSGPLTFAWSYEPAPTTMDLKSVDHVVTAGGAVFARYTAGFGPELDRLSATGQKAWSWVVPGGRDTFELHWSTVALGVVLVEDDGLFVIDAATGANAGGGSYDDWGQNTADGTRFYVNSDVNSPDGPGLYVGAYDPTGNAVWQKDSYKMCGTGVSETYGSLAVDGGKVYRSGVYSSPAGSASPIASGVAVYDAAAGTPGWTQPTTPASAISAGGGRVYLVERAAGGLALVARKESDGSVAWSQSVTAPSVQAPVVANDLVIVATSTDVRAFSGGTGAPAWTASGVSASASAHTFAGAFDNCKQSTIDFGSLPNTSLAAALGSNSLVVTAKDAVHILSLADGSDQWHGTPAKVTGPLRNPVIVGRTLYAVDTGAGMPGQLVSLTAP